MTVTEGNTNSSSHQQSKAELEWQGFTSLLLGFISLLIAVSIVAAHFHTWSEVWSQLRHLWDAFVIIPPTFIGPIFAGLLVAIAGFVLGITGLKYTKRRLAVAGIVLSVILFVTYAYLFEGASMAYE